ncbi:MAG: haloacid dehalogenase-like hydrolase [Candidatus Brocadiia bacterium]|jgi:phosphoserine phosphatase
MAADGARQRVSNGQSPSAVSSGPNSPLLTPNRQSAIGNRQSKSLVVLDVDGVIFPDQFMIALARRRGTWSFARTVTDCLLFNLGRIGLEELLRRSFGRLKGMLWQTACEVFRGMAIAPHAAETIAELKAAGRQVILLTSGVPDPFVKELAAALGADGGAGTLVEVKGGRLTGNVSGALARTNSKREFVARLIEREGIPWSHVVAVGDDPNNLSLMRRAGISIGFHAVYNVRREVSHLVESNDLADILPCALGAAGPHLLPHHPSAMRSWHHEILRKSLHMSALAVPFLAGYSVMGVSLLLLALAAGYLVLEFWRVHGVHLPLAHRLTQVVLRRSESRRLATAPLTLGFGMLVSLWCLPLAVAQACILIAAVADSAASIIGARWGRTFWSHNRLKSLEGSTAFLVSAIVCGSVYLPLRSAVPLAIVAALIESLPLQDWDNFVMPVGAGLIGVTLMGIG